MELPTVNRVPVSQGRYRQGECCHRGQGRRGHEGCQGRAGRFGRRRARAELGHPEPFGIRYFEIGNENNQGGDDGTASQQYWMPNVNGGALEGYADGGTATFNKQYAVIRGNWNVAKSYSTGEKTIPAVPTRLAPPSKPLSRPLSRPLPRTTWTTRRMEPASSSSSPRRARTSSRC